MSRNTLKIAAVLLSCSAMVAPAMAQGAGGETTGLTKDTIKVGVFGPLTGPASSFGKAELGIEAYYKDVNAHGGIYGRKIEVVQEDTSCNVAKGIAAVKKLISQDQVFALHGGSCSGIVLSVEPQIVSAGLPYMVGSAASSQIAEPPRPNVFQAVPNTATVARAMVDFAMSRSGAKKIALISHSDEWGKSNHDPAVAYLKSKYGLTPSADLTMERGATDATPQILKLRADRPDIVIAILYPAELAIFERDAFKYGFKAPVIGNQAITIERTRDQVGNPAAVDNLYVFYPMAAPVNSPEMKKWEDLNKRYNPDVKVDSASLLGLGGAVTFVHALKAAGPDLTRSKFIAALNATHDLDTGVLAGKISFSPTDHAGVKGGNFLHYKGSNLEVLHAFENGKS